MKVNKRKRRLVLWFSAALCAAVAVCAAFLSVVSGRRESRLYPPGNMPAVDPFSGYYTQVDSRDEGKIGELADEGERLILLAYNLNGYQKGPIGAEKLEELAARFSMARERCVRVIFRAAYGFSEGWDTVEPGSQERLLAHIGQIAPVLNEYKDALLCVQAGMIGPWGEWHSSSLLEGRSESGRRSLRVRVARAWLDRLDPEIFLQLRRPGFIREAVEGGADMARLGFHNDAIASSDSDMGTYDDRAAETAWLRENLRHGLTGGEAAALSTRSVPALAIAEFRRIGLTYLNSRYNTDVLEYWAAQPYEGMDALSYIEGHMGCRLTLASAVLPRYWIGLGGNARKIEIRLNNAGFSPPHHAFTAYLIAGRGESREYIPLLEQANSEGGIILTGKIPPPGPDEGEMSLRLLVGYGSPFACGFLPITLTNDEVGEDGSYPVASYRAAPFFWKLAEY